jgi:hypothetical protein
MTLGRGWPALAIHAPFRGFGHPRNCKKPSVISDVLCLPPVKCARGWPSLQAWPSTRLPGCMNPSSGTPDSGNPLYRFALCRVLTTPPSRGVIPDTSRG